MVERHYSSTAVETELSSGVDDSVGTMQVDSVTGYPTSYPFTIVIDPDTPSEELADVTDATGSTFTVTRGVDGTVGLSHESGAVVKHTLSGRDLQNSRDHEEASGDVHDVGASSDVVGTDTTQTLTNKTLDGDDNTFQDIPQSAVTDLVSDQGTQDSRLSSVEGDLSSLTSSFGDHENDQTGQHGVVEIVGRTESQTLTNKTIDGDDNTLRDIPPGALDNYWMRRIPSNMPTVQNSDDNLFFGSSNTIGANAPNGTWSGGGHSAQFTFPVDGFYLINVNVEYSSTTNNQSGTLHIRLMSNQSDGNADSGTQEYSLSQAHPNGSMGNQNSKGFSHMLRITDTNSVWSVCVATNAASPVEIVQQGSLGGTQVNAFLVAPL